MVWLFGFKSCSVVKCDFGLKVALSQIGLRPRPNAHRADLIDRAKEKDKQKEKC